MLGWKQTFFDQAGQDCSLTLIQGFDFSWIENAWHPIEMALHQSVMLVSSWRSEDGTLESFSFRLLENRSVQVTLVDLLDVDEIEISADRTRFLFFIFWITLFYLRRVGPVRGVTCRSVVRMRSHILHIGALGSLVFAASEIEEESEPRFGLLLL